MLEVKSKFSQEEFVKRMLDEGVRLSRAGTRIRVVTHLDVSMEDCEAAAQAIVRVANS